MLREERDEIKFKEVDVKKEWKLERNKKEERIEVEDLEVFVFDLD